MQLSCGIVGLPNVGKSTLFNALTRSNAAVANYPFCTIDPNTGVVAVPDERIDTLSRLYRPKKTTPTSIAFVDIAGLVKGASQGEGLGNQFLAHIREVKVIVHVVRCFDDPEIIHTESTVDPKRDIEVIETELLLKDLDTVEKRLSRSDKKSHSGDKMAQTEVALLNRIKGQLSSGKPVRKMALSESEEAMITELALLTQKQVLYAANLAEGDIEKGNRYSEQVERIAQDEGGQAIRMSCKIEAEIAALPPEDGAIFLKELGISSSALPRLIFAAYRLLGLATFFTVGADEVRGWTFWKGMPAVTAAGLIHSDIERGFIRAEVTSYHDLITHGSDQAVKEKGLLRLEGKEYLVQDGDCVYFRFNV
jgi:hypothetical protein